MSYFSFLFVKISNLCKYYKLANLCQGRLEGSLFNSYYTEVLGRAQLFSRDSSTYA